jgi:hypothetical protein
MNLTPRDIDLLVTLTLRLRMMTVWQVAQVWWPDGHNQQATRQRLARLVEADLVELHTVNAHPIAPARRPLSEWKPGQAEPAAADIAHRSKCRWRHFAVPTEICVATRRTANLLASLSYGLPRSEQIDHDLLLAMVYVRYRRRHPRLAALWVGEHALGKAGYGIKDPDAFLQDKRGRIQRVIESAGRYSVAQVLSFHEHCSEHDLPYELW